MAKQRTDKINFKTEGIPYYRTKEERRTNLKGDKGTWFRQMGATTTLMVPMTLNSRLAKTLREVIRTHQGPKGTVVKVVEKPGTPILAGLAPNNPFKQPSCPRDNCPLPNGSCQGKCSQENILYKATCNLCLENQLQEGTEPERIINRVYIGETSGTLRVRSAQHHNDLL